MVQNHYSFFPDSKMKVLQKKVTNSWLYLISQIKIFIRKEKLKEQVNVHPRKIYGEYKLDLYSMVT